jgi:hypothetical protein
MARAHTSFCAVEPFYWVRFCDSIVCSHDQVIAMCFIYCSVIVLQREDQYYCCVQQWLASLTSFGKLVM